MYLLILKEVVTRTADNEYLHPTMYLLILIHQHIVRLNYLNLHPTMYLLILPQTSEPTTM